jgi:hypothetical protein
MKAGVFCHNGLGDGVNCLVLSQNLFLNGWSVETFQNTIGSMQNWFPHLPVQPYPGMEALPEILDRFDRFFVVHNDSSDFVKALIAEGKRRFPEALKVIYLYPSKNIVNDPYYADCLTDPTLSVAANMRRLCEKVLHFPQTVHSNGFTVPEGLHFRKHMKRVVIHSGSSKPSRSWPQESFLKLADHIKEKGFDPVVIPTFPTLDEMARFIYESGYFVGNDSGPGHLASAIGIPTITFCRGKKLAKMWAPSFGKNIPLFPNTMIPNISGFRFRDRYWKELITVGMARRAFARLTKNY